MTNASWLKFFENYNGGLGEIKAQVDSGNIAWDIVDVLPSNAITGCDEGLFEDLGAQGQYDNFIPGFQSRCGLVSDKKLVLSFCAWQPVLLFFQYYCYLRLNYFVDVQKDYAASHPASWE